MIRTWEGLGDSEVLVPCNMVVLDGLSLQLDSVLAKVPNTCKGLHFSDI